MDSKAMFWRLLHAKREEQPLKEVVEMHFHKVHKRAPTDVERKELRNQYLKFLAYLNNDLPCDHDHEHPVYWSQIK